MQSLTKRRLSAAGLDALLREATGIGCRLEAELTDGWFNAAYLVRLDDGRAAVVKLAPPAEAPVLRYERGIMGTEAMVYGRLADLADGAVPAPELLLRGTGFLAVSVLEGTPWDRAAEHLPAATDSALRRELGAVTARLHTLTAEDGRFGYPAPEAGLSAADWRTAFTAMVDAVLEDAVRWGCDLGVPAAGIRTLVAEGGQALDGVTEPRLVHFDLWPGNIFVDDRADAPRITGVIDHERAFWGDPAAELVSLVRRGRRPGQRPDGRIPRGGRPPRPLPRRTPPARPLRPLSGPDPRRGVRPPRLPGGPRRLDPALPGRTGGRTARVGVTRHGPPPLGRRPAPHATSV
ncbi:phosphotransferase family protein [Streptomyces fuscichromogenes]|uniref:phosphotransferase family protein n=1 Tax=Streptomyces fuscichromogenes TaxID=1324013 RepID=UPI003806E0E1